jgi:outer membrane receptor protein involved in Fe transport
MEVMPLTGRSTLIACALFLATASGYARQTPPDTAGHSPTPLDTTRLKLDPVFRLPALEVVASILPTATGPEVRSGIPASSATHDVRSLAPWHPRLLTETLGAQPGISFYDDLGSPFKTTLVTRGFTASPVVGLPQGVTVFIDGVPVNEPDAGQVNFDLLPLEHVERIEFLSGTASLLGPNSLGGAINLITRRGPGGEAGRAGGAGPAGGAMTGEATLTIGSHSRAGADASLAGETGAWSFYAGGGHDREAGWRALTSARLYNLFTNLGRTGERAGFNIQLLGATTRAQTAGSLPLSVFTIRPDSNLTGGDFEALEQLHLAASGYLQIGAGLASARLFFRRHDAERFNVNQIDDPDVRSFSSNETLGLHTDWRTAFRAGPGTLGIRLGAGGSLNGTSIQIYGERIDPGLTTDVESPIRKLDGYVMAEYTLGRISLSGGARYDLVRVPFHNRLNPARDTVSAYHQWSPRGGIGLRLTDAGLIYASSGRSFRAPALIELACADPHEPCPLPFALGDDPPLDPVLATTHEIGTRWTFGPAHLSAAAYLTDVRDDIFLLPYEDDDEPQGSTIDGYFANIERTRRAGIELGSRLTLAGDHELYANYAYTRATFETDDVEIFSIREAVGAENEVEEGDRLPLVPDHTLAAGVALALPHGLRLGFETRYVGARYLRGDEANEEDPLDPYLTADMRLGFITRGWEVQGIVTNIFDKRYQTFGSFNINQGGTKMLERFLTPGHPRSFRLVLRRIF